MIIDRPIAITMGDPAGCGGEIVLKMWKNKRHILPHFFVIDDLERLRKLSELLNIKCNLKKIRQPEEAIKYFKDALPVFPVKPSLTTESFPGHPDPKNANAIIGSIDLATNFALKKSVKAIITNPIQKSLLIDSGFEFPGHTEYLGSLSGEKYTPIMMLITSKKKYALRVVPITRHIALKDAPLKIKKTDIVNTGLATAMALKKDFNIKNPRIFVAALNPHAGEGGLLGNEEREILSPAINILRKNKVEAKGPFSADTLFHSEARINYDAVLCMYHDQALIPIKTIDFFGSVNITLGLPFIRTSPDHGTAFDLAGKGTARETSLVKALQVANAIALNRFGKK